MNYSKLLSTHCSHCFVHQSIICDEISLEYVWLCDKPHFFMDPKPSTFMPEPKTGSTCFIKLLMVLSCLFDTYNLICLLVLQISSLLISNRPVMSSDSNELSLHTRKASVWTTVNDGPLSPLKDRPEGVIPVSFTINVIITTHYRWIMSHTLIFTWFISCHPCNSIRTLVLSLMSPI